MQVPGPSCCEITDFGPALSALFAAPKKKRKDNGGAVLQTPRTVASSFQMPHLPHMRPNQGSITQPTEIDGIAFEVRPRSPGESGPLHTTSAWII